jgi:hypothetical protein
MLAPILLCALGASACGTSQPTVTSATVARITPAAQTTTGSATSPAPGAHRRAARHARRPVTSRTTVATTAATDSASATTTTTASTTASRTTAAAPAASSHHTRAAAAHQSGRSAAAAVSPAKCLKFAGLGHVTGLSASRWQGTTGDNPLRDLNGSVFSDGPYPSVAAARHAASADELVEIAYPGGLYVVTATKRSYLSATVSLAAACLTPSGGKSYSF